MGLWNTVLVSCYPISSHSVDNIEISQFEKILLDNITILDDSKRCYDEYNNIYQFRLTFFNNLVDALSNIFHI